jgi:hypothetical protein
MGLLLSLSSLPNGVRRFRWLGRYCGPPPLSATFVHLPCCSSERWKALYSQGRKWAIRWSGIDVGIHRRPIMGRGLDPNSGIAEIPHLDSIICTLFGTWMRLTRLLPRPSDPACSCRCYLPTSPAARANLPRSALTFLVRDTTPVSTVPFRGLGTCRFDPSGQTTVCIRLLFLNIENFELIGRVNVLLVYTLSMILMKKTLK